MKWVFRILLVVILSLFGCGIFIYYTIGDIRPAFLPALPRIPANKQAEEPIHLSDKETGTKIPIVPLPFELTISDSFSVGIFAKGISDVRDLQFSPEGILLASVPTQGSIYTFSFLNDSIETKVLLSGLSKPHGIAFYKGKLFIAENSRLGRYSWDPEKKKAVFEKELLKLRSGSHDAHTIVFDTRGNLFVKVGSSCNVCDETDPQAATIIRTNSEGENPVTFAKGLRNAAFLTLNRETGDIYATENGRDLLGDDIPPEEINIIKQNKNYGWPICYGDRVHDTQFDKKNYITDPCALTEAPFFKMQAHSAPLGLTFIPESFSKAFAGDLLVAYHGSWNRSIPTGYKVVRIQIENGKAVREEDFLSGFLQGASAYSRPVDVEFDSGGNLFISDDKGGNIYVVSPTGK